MAMSTTTLARPYAKAAFELAHAAKMLPAWSAKLAQSTALLADPRIAAMVSSPRLQAKDRVALLLPAGDSPTSAFAHYLSALADNDRLSLLPQAQLEFEQLRAAAERTLAVTIRSALPIESAQQAQLIDKLSKRLNRSVSLNVVLEPALIGGAVIDAGNVVIDGSLSGKLQRMHTDLAA